MASSEETALRTRLAVVLKRFSQAQIARKTARSASLVSRYLKGTRIPATFLSDLVRQTGVNPTWLLVGEGSPWIQESGENSVPELVRVVQAMNVLSRLALGAIAGRGSAALLRDLERETAEAAKLRDRLDAVSAPALKRVLEEARAALNGFDVRRCSEAMKLARHVARFSRNDALALDLAEMESRLAMWERREDDAVRGYRPVFLTRLGNPGAALDEAALAALRYALMLQQANRPADACRCAHAASSLLGKPGEGFPAHPLLGLAAAAPLLEVGLLEQATSAIRLSLPGLSGNRRQVLESISVFSQVLAGTMGPAQAILLGPHIQPQAQFAIQVAAFLEDAKALEASLAYHGAKRVLKDVPDPELLAYGRRILRILRNAGEDPAEAGGAPEARTDAGRFRTLVFQSHIDRLARRRGATSRTAEAHALLGRLPTNVIPGLLVRAVHARNLLDGRRAERRAVRRAEAFLARHVEAGYGLFAGLLAKRRTSAAGSRDSEGPSASGF